MTSFYPNNDMLIWKLDYKFQKLMEHHTSQVLARIVEGSPTMAELIAQWKKQLENGNQSSD
jgi:hypothetical protein